MNIKTSKTEKPIPQKDFGFKTEGKRYRAKAVRELRNAKFDYPVEFTGEGVERSRVTGYTIDASIDHKFAIHRIAGGFGAWRVA